MRRLVKGERVMQAHRNHFYQRALIGRQSVYSIIGQIALLNIFLIALARMTIAVHSASVQIAAIVVGCLPVGWQLYRFEHRVV
jgi:hypothetical protein